MKKFTLLTFIISLSYSLSAQKVDYKKNIISVDDTEVGKVEVLKENFGLTKNFNLYSMNGDKLIIAVVSTEFANDISDNSSLYYRLTFVPTNQVGIFKVSSLSQEKTFVNLIGKSKIIEGNTLNELKVNELIATKGVTPKTVVNYTLVNRNKNWPIQFKDTKKIEQNQKEIGFFIPNGNSNGQHAYEFFLPSGVLIAKVNFAGGNNAQNFELFTPKDNSKRIVSIPQKDIIKMYASSVDPNESTLKRIALWLIDKNYM